MSDEFLTSIEVAELLHCSRSYVVMLVNDGHFPGTRKLNTARRNSPLRIPRSAVEAYIKSQIVTPEVQTEGSSEN